MGTQLDKTHLRQLHFFSTSFSLSSSSSTTTQPTQRIQLSSHSKPLTRLYTTQNNPATPTMAELKVGDTFPEGVSFSYVPVSSDNSDITSCGIPQKYDASKEFKNKEKLKAQGVDQVVVVAFNDAWVMSAWGKANGVKDDFIVFACDPEIQFSKSIGWFAGERTARYAIVVDHGKVTYAAKEEAKGSIELSGAEAVLAKL